MTGRRTESAQQIVTRQKLSRGAEAGENKSGFEVREIAGENGTQLAGKRAKRLDKIVGTERPWTPRGSSIPSPHHSGNTGIRTVDERFEVVDGPAARVLRAEQTKALHAVLDWLADHPETSTTSPRQRGKKSSTRNNRKGRE